MGGGTESASDAGVYTDICSRCRVPTPCRKGEGRDERCNTPVLTTTPLNTLPFFDFPPSHPHTQTSNLDEHPLTYAVALLNTAEIDIKIGKAAEDVYRNLDKANVIFSNSNYQAGIIFCELFRGAMQLREEKFALANVKLQQCLHLALGRNNEAALKYLPISRLGRLLDHNPDGL
jgi:hypothetical protein